MVNVKAHTRKTKKGIVNVKPYTRSYTFMGKHISVYPRQYTRSAPVMGYTLYKTAKNSYNIAVDSLIKYERVKRNEIQKLLSKIENDIKMNKQWEDEIARLDKLKSKKEMQDG